MRFAYTNPVITVGTAQQGRLAFALCGQCAMRGGERFRQDRLARSSTTLEVLALGLCALVGLRKALGNGAGVLFEVKPKEQLVNRPITCDYSKCVALNARKALREASKTLRTKTEERCRKGASHGGRKRIHRNDHR